MKLKAQTYFYRLIYLFLVLIHFTPSNVFSQNKSDSLLLMLSKANKDSNKVILLNDLAAEFFNNDKEKTQSYILQALSLAKEIKFQRGEAKAINSLGILTQKNGNYDSAMILQKMGLNLYTKLGDKKGIAKSYSDICIIHWRKSEFAIALDFQLKAMRIYEEIKDLKGIGYSYNMIGIIYKNLNKDNEALKYYLKSAEIKKTINDQRGLAATYQNIANIYKNKMVEDTAIEYYTKAKSINEKINNLGGVGFAISGLGDLKFKFQKYAEAKKYYLECLEIDKQVQDSNSLATTYINIGNACTPLKEYNTAREYIYKGLKILQNIGDKEGVMSAYEMLAYLYQEENNYEKALEYNQLYYQLKDSIMSLKEKDKIAELQLEYEVEKKDLELAKNKAELETKDKQAFINKVIAASTILLLIVILALGYVFYRKLKLEQQARIDAELSHQKDIRSKAIIEAEEKERIRIAKDLHDGVGQLLSAAKMNLSSVQSKIKLASVDEEIAFKNAIDLVDESVKEVRTVSHNMMPNTLLKMGLASAIREFVTKIQNTPNLKVNLEIVGLTERLEQEKESVLYRVIQEIVSNIIKHANATELGMQLIKHEKEFTILIEDNGVGFDISKLHSFEGIGIKNIQSRIEFINGSVHFDSELNKGTRVIIDIPV